MATSPSFLPLRTGCVLSQLDPVTVDNVVTVIRKLPDKQCSTDILPTSLLKKCADELAPFLTHLFNRSLSDGAVPASFKSAFITPRLKKPGLDAAEACSYQPISNLSVISKMLERLVATRLLAYLDESGLMPSYAVCVSSQPLDRDGCSESVVRHSSSARSRRFRCSSAPRFVSGI